MPVFAVVNPNAGVGKTTSAVNLATCFGSYGADVLVVDCDPEATATAAIGQRIKTIGLAGALLNGDLAGTIAPSAGQRVDLMSAGRRLEHAEYHMRRTLDRLDDRLRTVLEPLRPQYNFIFLDCASASDFLTISALSAADLVLIPVRPGRDEMGIFDPLREQLEQIRTDYNPALRVFGILMTMYEEGREETRSRAAAITGRYPDLVFRTRIPFDPRAREAFAAGQPLVQFDPAASAARAYTALAAEFSERLTHTWSYSAP